MTKLYNYAIFHTKQTDARDKAVFTHTGNPLLIPRLKNSIHFNLWAGYIAHVTYAERTFQHYAFTIINETGYTGHESSR